MLYIILGVKPCEVFVKNAFLGRAGEVVCSQRTWPWHGTVLTFKNVSGGDIVIWDKVQMLDNNVKAAD